MTKNKCYLFDRTAKKSYPLYLQKARRENLNLALVTYKQYAEKQKVKNNEDDKEVPIPPDYQKLIDQHKSILTINFHDKPRHNIVQYD